MIEINPALAGVPLALALGGLGLRGWRRDKKRRKEKEMLRLKRHTGQLGADTTPLPDGAAPVFTDVGARTIRADLIGAFMLVGIGGFGTNQLIRLLTLLAYCKLEALVGSILLIENDAQQRNQFHRRLPPVFLDRVVYGYSDAYSGGIANRSIEWAMQRIDTWGGPIELAVAEVSDRHLRRNANRAPSDIFVFVSLGGHGPLGLPVMELLHERFEESLTLAFTTLPRHERLRQRYALLKPEYERRGVFAWVLSDNLGADPVTSDFGMVGLIVGLADAALHADQSTQPNNAFTLALTEQPGAVLTYQVAAAEVVGYPMGTVQPPRYYVFRQPVVEQVLKMLRRIEEGRGAWSADLPVGEQDTSIFDLVLISLDHEDLRTVEDDVTRGRRLRAKVLTPLTNGHATGSGALFGQPNYETPFASMATVVNPERPVCPVVVVRLNAVRDGVHLAAEIATAPSLRSLPRPHHSAPNANENHPSVSQPAQLIPTITS